MERAIYYTNFRNLGFEHSERLILNNTLEKGKMGNLVILIGPNNSGKSNILDGLTSFGAKKICERDITTLSYEREYRKPQLSLSIKDCDDEYTYRISLHEKDYIKYPNSCQAKLITSSNLTLFSKDINIFLTWCNQYGYNDVKFISLLEDVIKLINDETPNLELSNVKLLEAMNIYFNKLDCNNHFWLQFTRNIPTSEFVVQINKVFDNKNSIKLLEDSFKNKYNLNFFPKIINYVEHRITNNDISCNLSNMTLNKFFKNLFNVSGITFDEIINVYKVFNEQNNKAVLRTLENKMNEKLKSISDHFNELYYADDKYRFEISLETNKIFFLLFRGTKDISLDYQSEGFRWFFDLYFNLLSQNSLDSGDIIVLDEPATKLHCSGQRELRKILKEYAIKNDLTIIMATHSPFLIDLDYLDELRVVSMSDNVAKINNDYTTVDINDPDSLKPIKNALTVNNHVLLDPDIMVVFVEGITDYNYYTAFKKKLCIDDKIVFLPIKGIGDINSPEFKNKQLAISKGLIAIKKHNPILLVDGDKAGQAMKQLNRYSELVVFTLKDIFEDHIVVEDLFEKEDLRKIKALDDNGQIVKKSSNSSVAKTFVDSIDFSKVSMNNFKKIFDFLTEKNQNIDLKNH